MLTRFAPGLARAGALCLALAGPEATAQERRPNVILIMADDIGTECFGSYGGTSYQTPVLDRLAARGMRFAHCHSQPLCTPSRVKIMTGQSNARNYRAFGILGARERTFGHLMQGAGYATAVVGKWQLYGAAHYREGIRGKGMHPRDAGFDHYCLWQVEKLGSRYWAPTVDRDGELRVGAEDDYGPDIYCKALLDFLEARADGPFFAYFPMALPHNPFVAAPATPAAQHGGKDPAHFASMVAHIDTLVGRIVDKIEALGIADRTLILFTADNGTNRKIRSQCNGETVRGGKGRTTDAGTHVPLIAYWPGTVAQGVVCDDLVDFSDVVPTLADLAGEKIPSDWTIDGRSFLPQLRGEMGQPRAWIYCYYHPRPLTRARSKAVRFARNQRFKLYGNGALFDVAGDPLEATAIDAADQSDEAAAARAMLQKALDAMPAEAAVIGQLR